MLRHRNLRLLVTGGTVSQFGSAITPIALAFAVLDLGGSATQLGLVEAVFALCEVVTTLFGGVLGDRVPRKVVMEGSAALCAVVTGVMATLVVLDVATIPLLAVFGGLNGVVGAINGPSSRAMTPLVVPADEARQAVAVRSVFSTLTMTAGFALAGVLVAIVGPGWAIGVDAATYLVAAIAFSLMRVPQTFAPSGASMLGDLGEGLREVLKHSWLWFLILQALLYHLFFGGAQSVLGPIVVSGELGRQSWGFALSALMAGFVIGGLVCLRWHPRRALRNGVLALSLTGLFPLAMALSDNLLVLLAGAFAHGFGLQIFSVFWESSINAAVPPEKLARVHAFDSVGSFVARPIGLALTGPVATAAGYDTWLIVVACVVSGSSLLALTFSGVRHLEATPRPAVAP